jgi:hypothetical protein
VRDLESVDEQAFTTMLRTLRSDEGLIRGEDGAQPLPT